MSAPLSNILLRRVPEHLLKGLASGEMQIYGSIIRSVKTGHIAGHLQETARLTELVGANLPPLGITSANPLGLVGFGLNAIGQAATIVQNEQIKTALAGLKALELANLALNAVAIGVSVSGTVILSRHIARVEDKVELLIPHLHGIARGVEALRQDRIAEDFTRLRTLVAQLDECWSLSNPEAEWRSIARDAHLLADSFERRAQEVLADCRDAPATAEPFVEAFSVASSVRISARLAAGDDAAARSAAEARAKSLIELGRPMQLGRLALAKATASDAEPGTGEWTAVLESAADDLRPAIEFVRQREACAATSVRTLEELGAQEISGRAWLEAAREHNEGELLFLPAR